MRPHRFIGLLALTVSLHAPMPATSEPSPITAVAPVLAGGADAGFLGIYADLAGTQQCASIPAGSVGTLHLIATLAGETSAGITGAEFCIEVSNPTGYLFQYQPPSTANVVLGTAFDLEPNDLENNSGINVAFPVCQTGRVNLGQILVLNMTGGPTELRLVRRSPPTDPPRACPLFVHCDSPSFTLSCMRACVPDAYGRAVASRLQLNDPSCTGELTCAADCAPAPCVTVAGTGPTSFCPGTPFTVTATATNCAATPSDIDLFIEFGLAGSFTSVDPGETVTASRTVDLPCNVKGPWIGALARTAGCAVAAGRERTLDIDCGGTACDNRPPDCSAARPSLAQLWPPDGRLIPVSIEGVTDPDGDPLEVLVTLVGSDERAGANPSACPDAIFDGSSVRLRAERNPTGNGRWYVVGYRAFDPSGLRCDGDVAVCVPRKEQGGACEDLDPPYYDAQFCESPGTSGGSGKELTIAQTTTGLEARFASAVDGSARLEVFDVRGRFVSSVLHTRLAPGEHVVRWNGRDASGGKAAAGIYVFKLQIGTQVLVSKGVLVH